MTIKSPFLPVYRFSVGVKPFLFFSIKNKGRVHTAPRVSKNLFYNFAEGFCPSQKGCSHQFRIVFSVSLSNRCIFWRLKAISMVSPVLAVEVGSTLAVISLFSQLRYR